jgi:O-antigen/teichoic acid export membrane protein
MKLGSALIWTLISVLLISSMKLLGNLSLTRLLSPDTFGIVAVIIAITTSIEMLTDIGTTPSIIRSPRTDADWLDTAWTLGLLRGISIAIVLALAAVPLAKFFNEDRLIPLIAASGAISLLGGVRSTQAILATRNLQVKAFAIVELFSVFVGYCVMLFWAWLAPSAWALLAGSITIPAISTGLSFWAYGRRKHRLCWNRDVVKEFLSFGKWIFLSSLLSIAILQGDRFAVGKLQGLHAAGIYYVAVSWSGTMHTLFYMFAHRLYLPILSQIKHLNSSLAMVTRLRYLVSLTMILPYALLAGTAEQLILFLYSPDFAGAGIVLAILIVGVWFSGLEYLYNDQLMLEGQPAWRSYAQILSLLAIGAALLFWRDLLSLAIIAALFTGGNIIRTVFLMIANDRSQIRQIVPDLAIVALFLALCLAIWSAAGMIAAHYSAFIALVVCSVVIVPIGGAVAWFTVRRALDIAATVSAEAGTMSAADPGLEVAQAV